MMFSKDQIESPVVLHQGFPVKGLTRIIAGWCNLNSEMLAWCAFRFGIAHLCGASPRLISLEFSRNSNRPLSYPQFSCTNLTPNLEGAIYEIWVAPFLGALERMATVSRNEIRIR